MTRLRLFYRALIEAGGDFASHREEQGNKQRYHKVIPYRPQQAFEYSLNEYFLVMRNNHRTV